MPITAQHVRETLDAYLAQHPDEKDSLSVLSEVIDEAAAQSRHARSSGGT